VSVTFADNDERRVFTDNAGGLVSILNPVRTSQTRCWRGNDASLARHLGCISESRSVVFRRECGNTERALRLCIRTPHFRSKYIRYSLNWSQSAG
jgi:hypothetical protein